MSAAFRKCQLDGCGGNAHYSESGKRGYCNRHYLRALKFGDPHHVGQVPSPALDWLRAHVTHDGEGCLPWPFHVGRDGYGRVHRPQSGALTTASRLMCEMAQGERPSRLHEAAHRCGRGSAGCVNPRHLYWATPAQNHADKVEHGTSNRGERQGNSRLTEAEVREIRRLIGTRPMRDIADQFRVSQSHVAHIKSGKAWGWLTL